MKNTYQEMRKRHQKEINSFPIKFAFSDKQFEEGMRDLGLEPTETDKVCKVGRTGGFIRKSDLPALKKMLGNHGTELQEAIDADETGNGFIREMFYYELCNHEYGYTMDAGDALDALGYSIEQINKDKRLLAGFTSACEAASKVGW